MGVGGAGGGPISHPINLLGATQGLARRLEGFFSLDVEKGGEAETEKPWAWQAPL